MALRSDRTEYMRRYRALFKAKHGCSVVTAWRRNNPDANEAHRDTELRRWYTNPTIRQRHAVKAKKNYQKLKAAAYLHYGGPVCACCGETEGCFLSLDHINNDGAAHRKRTGAGCGISLYLWLRKNSYPPGLQVLCMNCNFGKRMNSGVCPHKRLQDAAG